MNSQNLFFYHISCSWLCNFLGYTAEKEFNKLNRVDSKIIRPGTSTEAAWVDTETWAYQLPAGMCNMSTLCVHVFSVW